jgi:hypothetical protein
VARFAIQSQVRTTLRCLRDDLRIPPPPPGEDIGDVDHAITRKAHDLAAAYPAGQTLVKLTDQRRAYCFFHGSLLVLTYRDEAKNVIWICGVARDEPHFRALARQGKLFPSAEDAQRLELDRLWAIGRLILESVPVWVDAAYAEPECEHEVNFGETRIFFYVERSPELDMVWLAMPTLRAPYPICGLHPKVRAVIAAAVERECGAESLWERVSEWPTRDLPDYEIALLGITRSRQ